MHQGGLPAGQVAHDSLKRSKGQSLGLRRQSARPRGRWESEDDHMCAPAGRPNGLAGPPPEEEARRPLAAASPSAALPAPRALPVPSRTAVASLQHLGRRVPAPRASRSVRVRARHTVTQDRATRGHSGAFHQDLGVGPPRDRAVGAGYHGDEACTSWRQRASPLLRTRGHAAGLRKGTGPGPTGAAAEELVPGLKRPSQVMRRALPRPARVTWRRCLPQMGCQPGGWDTRTRGAGPPGSHTSAWAQGLTLPPPSPRRIQGFSPFPPPPERPYLHSPGPGRLFKENEKPPQHTGPSHGGPRPWPPAPGLKATPASSPNKDIAHEVTDGCHLYTPLPAPCS